MLRTIIAMSSISLVSACVQPTESAPKFTNDPVPIPDPIHIVGAAGPVEMAAAELRGDGINVETSSTGRAAGITAFCSGEADALALTNGQDLSSAERDRCRELKDGWGWSALSTQRTIFYVRFGFAQDLLDRAPTAL